MFKKYKKFIKYLSIILLIVLVTSIYLFIFKINKYNNYLKISFLDVGQGDSIYIEAPNGRQVLIDSGPDAKLLQSLAKVMPFADRSIDMIIATHADSDHIGGFPLLIDNYSISTILENGATGSSQLFSTLEEKIDNNKINKIIAQKGMKIFLDDENKIYLEILYPNRDISSLDSNETSIVCRLVYGNNSFMLMGDADIYVENLISWSESKEALQSDILKLGHHGSKSSSSFFWLEKVSPQIAIISAGENNRYGHPSEEVLDRLKKLDILYLATYELGNINFESNGEEIIRK